MVVICICVIYLQAASNSMINRRKISNINDMTPLYSEKQGICLHLRAVTTNGADGTVWSVRGKRASKSVHASLIGVKTPPFLVPPDGMDPFNLKKRPGGAIDSSFATIRKSPKASPDSTTPYSAPPPLSGESPLTAEEIAMVRYLASFAAM